MLLERIQILERQVALIDRRRGASGHHKEKYRRTKSQNLDFEKIQKKTMNDNEGAIQNALL